MPTNFEPPFAHDKSIITYSRWQAYTWKNELAEQRRRVDQHLREIIEAEETDHDPAHMLERALGVAALCMRRLIECLLVTDKFRHSQIVAYEIAYRKDKEWREPFASETGGSLFESYNFQARTENRYIPKIIADKMLHARVIAVIAGSATIPDGLLIASDTQRKSSLFHFTRQEITELFNTFLSDEVTIKSDGYIDENGNIIESGKPISIRK